MIPPFLRTTLRDCRAATLLLEQREARPLHLRERLGLIVHLRYCVYCRRYAAQTRLLTRAARQLAESIPTARLPEARKAHLRRLLRAG